MTPVLAIAFKDLRLMLRDRPGLVFTLVFPLLFGVFFGSIYADSADGDRQSIPVALVDGTMDGSLWGERFAQRLASSDHLQLLPVEETQLATDMLRSDEVAAVLVIPAAFDAWLVSGGTAPTGAPELTVASSAFGQTDLVRGIVAAGLYQTVFSAFAPHGDEDPVSSTGFEVEFRILSHPKSDGPPNSFAFTFPQAIMWAVLGCAASFAVGLVNERHGGTLVRLRLTPIGARQILAGKGAACMAVSMAVSLLFVAIGRIVFGVVPVSLPLLLVAIVFVCFAFAGLMMLLAVLGQSRSSPGQLAWGVILVMAITGGGMLPLHFMPEWLVAISHFSPVKWGILAIEGGIWRSTTLPDALLPLGVLFAVGLLGFFVGTRSLLLSERLTTR
ncbi:MAG: ABC transporter permease [Phycisphaerales bacterium JB065]